MDGWMDGWMDDIRSLSILILSVCRMRIVLEGGGALDYLFIDVMDNI